MLPTRKRLSLFKLTCLMGMSLIVLLSGCESGTDAISELGSEGKENVITEQPKIGQGAPARQKRFAFLM